MRRQRAACAAAGWQCTTCDWRAARRDGVTVLVADVHEIVEAFSAEQFHDLVSVEWRHFWFAARNELIAWALSRFFPEARSFLEVGCGTGRRR